ncbi:hypothetical protein D9613_004486 [Agrocybe pediades]|uniref:F-box domain-containing protein n=1 Tax=Agrocybe pediades TaxID=84607 RepID=A0A8H4QJR6_9AGAR|nr:hypothetical protein D9613_004486 [Agrocybe pediades]
MVHCHRKASNVQSNSIDLSQLDYEKSTCPANLEHTCNLCQKLHTLEKDVEKAIAGLKQLLNRHQNLKTETNRTHSPIIRDLPVEILSKIFYSCISEEMRKVDGEPNYGDDLVPLQISAVCRTWRQVAWSSPELWTVMCFRRDFLSATHACLQYAIMKEWVSRSGALPVYVTLYEEAMKGAQGGRMVAIGCRCWELSLDLLARCSNRWKDVDVEISRASFEYIARHLKLKPPTRKLALASAEVWDHINSTDVLKLWQESEFGPQHLRINRSIRLQHISIDWKHVTHVEIRAWIPKECASLLRYAPQLVSCLFEEVVGDASVEFPDLGGPPICHPSLRSLHFQCCVPAAPFFDCIALPFLEEFEYSNYIIRNGMADPFLMSFFSRSSFPLKKLSLDAYMFTPEYLVAVLDLVPTLVRLELSFSYTCWKKEENSALMVYLLSHLATAATLSNNAGSGASDEFLPRLEVLEVHQWVGPDFPWTFVPDFVGFPSETGKPGQRSIKSIAITTHNLPPPQMLPDDVVNRLVSLQQVGVNLGYRASSNGLKFVPATWEAIQLPHSGNIDVVPSIVPTSSLVTTVYC